MVLGSVAGKDMDTESVPEPLWNLAWFQERYGMRITVRTNLGLRLLSGDGFEVISKVELAEYKFGSSSSSGMGWNQFRDWY